MIKRNDAIHQRKIKRERDKVQQRLELWAKNQHQINAKILNAFLVLRERGKTPITEADIENKFRKENPRVRTFKSNFTQMVHFGERNHGKVFERDTHGKVDIWPPVAKYVKEYEHETENEWQVRRDLAACYRLFVHFGWTDLIFTHLTARVPGAPNQYLINPYGLLFEEITASNLLKVDFDGNVIAGDFPFNEAGHAIHTAILRARPEVNAVLHSHTRAGMAVSCMRGGLLPLTQQANEMMELVGSHDYDVVFDNQAECRQLGQDMGDKWLMLMHNHGLLSAGRTVAEAFYFLYMLENACKVQVDVMAAVDEPIIPCDSARASLAGYGRPPAEGPADFVSMSWKALIRMLDRKDASYQD